jgi:hypothetical protein
MALRRIGGHRYRLSFIAPGDNGACGTPARYRAWVNGRLARISFAHPPPGGRRVRLVISFIRQPIRFSLDAVNHGGVPGIPASVAIRSSPRRRSTRARRVSRPPAFTG